MGGGRVDSYLLTLELAMEDVQGTKLVTSEFWDFAVFTGTKLRVLMSLTFSQSHNCMIINQECNQWPFVSQR